MGLSGYGKILSLEEEQEERRLSCSSLSFATLEEAVLSELGDGADPLLL